MRRNNHAAIRQLGGAIDTNELIYWLRRSKILRRFISQNAYSNPKYKRWFRILSALKAWFNALVFTVVTMGVLVFVSHQAQGMEYLIHPMISFHAWQSAYLFFVIVLLAVISQRKVLFEDSKFKWLVVDQFHARAVDYYRFSILEHALKQIAKGIIYAIPLFVGNSVWGIFVLLLPTVSFFTQEGLVLRTYRIKKERESGTLIFFRTALIVMSVIIAFAVIRNIQVVLILCVVLWSVGSISFYYEYTRLDDNTVSASNRYMKQTLKLSSDHKREMIELQVEEARIDEDVDVSRGLAVVDTLSGFRMINRLFYLRHQRIWMKSLTLSVKIIGAAGIVIVAGIIFCMVFFYQETVSFGIESFSNPLYLLKMFLFVLGFTNFTESVIKAFFLNCDSALMHYAFYRRKDIVWKQYLSRLGTLVSLNLIPVLLMCSVLVILVFIGFIPFTENFMYLLFNAVLFSVFITAFNLVLYYLIQPYNQDMEMKSPLYGLLSGALYFAMYQIPTDFFANIMNYNIWVVLSLGIFIIASCTAVYLVGEHTFKLRR